MTASLNRRVLVALVSVLLLSTEVAWAKTNLTRALIEGPGLATPLEIADWWELDLLGRAMRDSVPTRSGPVTDIGVGYRITLFVRSRTLYGVDREWGAFDYYPGSERDRGYIRNSPYHGCDASLCWERASRLLDSWMASHLPSPSASSTQAGYLIYVVTVDNEVLVVDPMGGGVSERIPIGATYRPVRALEGRRPSGLERTIVHAPSRGSVYVLDHDPDENGDLTDAVGVRVIGTSSMSVVATYALSMSDSYFWNSLAIAPAGDYLYLLGYRLVDVPNGYWELKVLEMDTATGQLIQDYSLYPAGTVFQSATDSAGSALYIAYHGASEGVDVLNLTSGWFFPPHSEELPAYGGIQAHGGVIRGPDGRMYAPTEGGAALVAIAPAYSEILETMQTGLGDSTHMPEMATSPTEDVLYLLGGCTALEGSKKLYALNVRSAEFRVLSEGSVCGRRLVVSPDGRFLAVLRDRPVPRDVTISIIDARSGEIVRDIPLNTAALDLVSVPSAPSVLPTTGEELPSSVSAILFMGTALVILALVLRRAPKGALG